MITPVPIRVLHVDDDQSFLIVSKQILADKESFIIETALSVDDALTKLSQQNFDVVISDYYLPSKTGLELLKVIREKGSRIPFIMFTGKGREEIIVQALNLGADRFIDKLGEPEVVYTELSIAIKQVNDQAHAERLLWESEERFKKMVTYSNDLIMLTRTDGVILYISPSCKKILGYNPEELEGKNPWVIHPEDTECIQKILQLTLTTEASGAAEYRIITKQGETKWVNHSFSQIIENGNIKQVVSIVRDITETRNNQAKLAESETKFSAAFYSSGAGMSIATLSDGLFVDVNTGFLQLFGYNREEVLGKTVAQLNFYANFNDRQEIINLIQRNQQVINREVVFRRKDSQNVIVLVSTKILKIKNRDHLLTTFIDITNLKKTEKALLQSQKEIEASITMAPVAVIVFDINGLIVTCNELAAKLLQTAREELIGKNAVDFIDEQDRTSINNDLKTTLKDHRILNKEFTIKRSNGDKIRVEGSIRAVFDESGKPTVFVISSRDITEKVEREKKIIALLEESKRRESDLKELLLVSESVLRHADFETVLERILTSFKKIVSSDSGIILLISKKSGEITLFQSKEERFTSQKGIPKPLLQVCQEMCPSNQAIYINNIEQSKFAYLTKQMPHLAPYNTAIIPLKAKEDVVGYIVLANKQAGFNSNDLLIATLLAEFAEIALDNNAAIQAVANREKQLRAITDSAKDAIIVIDSEGKITFWSSAAVSMFGYDSNDVCGRDFHKLFAPSHYLEAYEKGFAVFRETGLGAVIGKTIELTAQKANRQEFPIELSLSGLKLNELWYAVGIIRDISERKKDREERDCALAQTKLLLEKLSVVGGFVRHDIRNKLSLVNNTLYLSKKYATDNQQLLKQLEKIGSATDSVTRILEFAQTYEAVGIKGLSWIKITDTIAEAKQSFLLLSDLQVDIANIDFEVLADPALCEIFHNLFDNSIKYGQNLTKIKILSEKTQNGDLNIVYEDDGGGIDIKIKQRLFEKGAGKGTGLGLYLIQRICEVYGWQVKETGVLGKGVRFEITVPQKSYRPTIFSKL